MTQVLLVNSPVSGVGYRHSSLGPPVGLAYIGAILLEHGFTVSALDLNAAGSDSDRLLRMRIQRETPAILGISSRTPDYPQARDIARLAKNMDSELKVVVGGPHSTFLPEQVLSDEEVDIAVVGEGELTMLELARHFVKGQGKLEEIKGIAFRDSGKVRVNEPRPFVDDLDCLPFPARHLFTSGRYRYPFTILTSRGCPANCIFCSVNKLCGRQVRYRRVEKVVEEVSYILENCPVRSINFIDDSFSVDRRRTMDLCKQLYGLPVGWSCATRVNYVDGELLEVMAKANCRSINYGIESGSQRVLDSIGKGITVERAREAARLAAAVGIKPLCSFLLPHPADNRESISETLTFAEELRNLGCDISLNFTAPLPGTPLHDERDKYGIRIEAASWADYDGTHSIVSTRYFGAKEIETLVNDWIHSQGWHGREIDPGDACWNRLASYRSGTKNTG